MTGKTRGLLTGLLCAVVLTLWAGNVAAQGTLTGAPGVSGAGPSVTLAVPSRVGINWDRDVSFDLTVNTNPGTCLSYPPAPATSFPCYWDDAATQVHFKLFANTAGGGLTVNAVIQGQAGSFPGSNATIANVLYATPPLATCAAGTAPGACAGYTIMSSAATTALVSAVAPTTGWTANIDRKFIFQVANNLTPTTGGVGQTRTTTITLTTP